MKKIVSVVLCALMLLSLAACGNSENPQATEPEQPKVQWLPYGLEFGMTYDAFCAKLAEAGVTAPSLRPASSNDGYLTGNVDVDETDREFWAFLESEEIDQLVDYAIAFSNSDLDSLLKEDKYGVALDFAISTPVVFFSFNQDKELYECYLCLEADVEDEFATTYLTALKNVYNKKFNISNTTTSWENDAMGVSITSYNTDYDGVKQIILTLHCKTYDLNS